MLLFALPESADHGAGIAAALGTKLSELQHRDFGDGECRTRPVTSVTGAHVCVIQSLYADADLSIHDKLCRLLFLISTMRDHGAARVTALLPYLAYGRSDHRAKPRDPLSTRYLAQLLEAVSCDAVITFETHNVAAFENAFRIRTLHLALGAVFQDMIAWRVGEMPLVVMSPDPGGVKRAQLFREAMQDRMSQEVGFGFMEKRRRSDVMTHGNLVGDYADRSVVIVDDMIASGNTMITAAKACKAHGAGKVYAVAAHGLFLAGSAALFSGDLIERVFVSDSIPPFRLPDGPATNRLTVLNTADEFADTLRSL